MEYRTYRAPSLTESLWYVLPAIAVLLLAHPDVFRIRFLNDDFVFLDRARAQSVLDAFQNRETPFGWYRPWSREIHYLVAQRLFGPSVVAFHALSVALFLGVAFAYGHVASLLAGPTASRFATAGFLVMSAWAVPVLWIAGVQDLWMVLAAFLYLETELRERPRWIGAVLLSIALLSKETAAVLPFLSTGLLVTFRCFSWSRAARRAAPGFALLFAWTLVHPRLGGRLFSHASAAAAGVGSSFDPGSIPRTIGSVVNLDRWPTVPGITGGFLAAGAVLALTMALLLWLAARREKDPGSEESAASRSRLAAAVWMLLGWLPAMAAGSSWHATTGF